MTDTFTINLIKLVLSENGPCNNGKGYRHFVDYQVDEEAIMPFFIKTPKKIFTMVYHGNTRTLLTQRYLMFLRQRSGFLSIKRSGMTLSHSYLKNWQQDQ